MKSFILHIIILFCSCQVADEQQCSEVNMKAFTHHFEDKLSIYKNINGALLNEIDSDEEAGWIVEIIGVNEDYFEININDLNIYGVWVLKPSLGLNTRNYDGQSISLYREPTKKSDEVARLDEEQTVMILDACKDWAYIKGKSKDGKEVEGWLEPSMQCGNPYTTCP